MSSNCLWKSSPVSGNLHPLQCLSNAKQAQSFSNLGCDSAIFHKVSNTRHWRGDLQAKPDVAGGGAGDCKLTCFPLSQCWAEDSADQGGARDTVEYPVCDSKSIEIIFHANGISLKIWGQSEGTNYKWKQRRKYVIFQIRVLIHVCLTGLHT